MDELCRRMNSFELEGYKKALQKLWKITELKEDGQASKQIVDIIEETLKG